MTVRIKQVKSKEKNILGRVNSIGKGPKGEKFYFF
jgi:hypothetical protein